MGQEIPTSVFTDFDFDRYFALLEQETATLESWFQNRRFCSQGNIAGFELEAWLVYKNSFPAPINEAFINRLNSHLVTPELSKFNIELNTEPIKLSKSALSAFELDLTRNWNQCIKVANAFNIDLVMIGILPSLTEKDLTVENMSNMQRYHALNQQVFEMRKGLPLTLNIAGKDHLKTTHYNVMLEASTTSFQVHLQFEPEQAVRFYNASIIVSAATVAVSVNSPYLFGYDLWDESRIPLFEQAVEVGGYDGAAYGPTKRVGFGTAYAKSSLFECFKENLQHFPIMLPIVDERKMDRLHHLILHNGTIWRWNRPLIGFTEKGDPTLRIEHRVIPGGPTIIDMIANTAFYYGLVYYMATMIKAPENEISFSQARDNFYHAAKKSLHAQVEWLDQRRVLLGELVLSELVPMAKVGLQMLQLDNEDIDLYLNIIRDRVENGQTGAAWQRAYVKKHGNNMAALTAAYLQNQKTAQPVHTWKI